MPIFGQTTALNTCEIRGQITTGNFEWTARNFAGFYYDIDDDLGTEKITTTVQKNDFDFED